MKKYLILYAVLVTAALVVALRHFRSENRRLVQNQETLASDLTHYRTRAGEEAAAARVLRLRCAEFERLRTEDAAEIRRLGIRLRRLQSTAKIPAMILTMIASCNFFGAVFSRLGGATFISNQLLSMHLSPMVMLAIILIIIFFMGWAMEWIPIILILVPLTLPVVDAMGYDKLWYCMLVAVTLQTSWLSPPVALSAYYIKGALPHWKITDIYKGMFQYIGCQVVGMLLIILFPAIATWLPQALK